MNRSWSRALLILGLVAASTTGSSRTQDADPPPSLLISRQLSESRRLRSGDVVTLAADRVGTNARRFRIGGVYEPMPDPMRFAQRRDEARLHLPDLLALTADRTDPGAAESITSINVALRNSADAAAFSRDVSARLPALTARPIDAPDDRTSTFIVLERFHLAIAVVTVVGSAVFLLALMVMLVDERRGVVGTLRLIGFTRRRILLQVLTEGTLIATIGAVFGIAFALAMQNAFNRFFQWRYDTTLIFLRITPDVVWQALVIAVPLGIIASLIASWTLLRRPILALVRR